MLPSGKVVKKTANAAMKGNWSGGIIVSVLVIFSAFLSALVSSVLYTVTGYVLSSLFTVLFMIFLAVPLFLGALAYFRAVAWGEKQSVSYAFYCFSCVDNYARALAFSAGLVVRVFVARFIFMLPSVIARAFSGNELYESFGLSMPVWATGLSVLAVLLRIAGALLTAAVLIRYYPAPFAFVANENLSPGQCIKLSIIISRGHRVDFFWFLCSMAGYIALSVFVVPLAFTLPYFLICYIVHCRFLIADYNLSDKGAPDMPSFNL